jgi:hypothetical protein
MSGRRSPQQLENAAWASVQRTATIERSNGYCEMEVAILGLMPGETHYSGRRIVEREHGRSWVRCYAVATDAAHLFRRWVCGTLPTDDGPPLKHHELVVVAACRDCHTLFDSRLADDRVRPPLDRMALAKALIDHTLLAAEARSEAVSWPWPRPERKSA